MADVMKSNLAAKLQSNGNVVIDEPNQCSILPAARKIRTFAVFDLETNGLSYLKTQISITELAMYCFTAEALESESNVTHENATKLPELPRVVHKLTLLFNPRRLVQEQAEQITGLNNFILEHESPFNENVGTILTSFIEHLQQPVCLVAHNGDYFDFPLLKQSLDKLNVQLPSETMCVDSLRAFWGIEEQLELMLQQTATTSIVSRTEADTLTIVTTNESESITKEILETKHTSTQLETATIIINDLTTQAQSHLTAAANTVEIVETKNDETTVNWQQLNEATPKRSTTANNGRPNVKRQNVLTANNDLTPSVKRRLTKKETVKSRRVLFPSKPTGKYPPKGKYKLAPLYVRVFGQSPQQAHWAGSDVEMLTKLMLAHGRDFLAYAEKYAKPFAEAAWN